MQANLSNLNSQISIAKNELNSAQNKLITYTKTLDEIEQMRKSESVIQMILNIVNKAKNLDIYFEGLCIFSGNLRLVATSQNPSALSEFASRLSTMGIEAQSTKIEKDSNAGYKAIISVF